MDRNEPAIGIDLGTTFSAVACLDELGRPQTLVNAEGDQVTPSAILFEGDEVIVGKEAVKALATEADQVATCFKRSLGQRLYPRPLGGREYPPEALEAWVLHKLHQDAARQVGAFDKAVITVPAYFDEVRRKATQDAGYIAGLDVLDIINEPTAAALAFGLKVNNEQTKPLNLLVYDLGGGTFDVTVTEVNGGNFVALATDGDVRLGGQDWDQRLVDYVAEDFKKTHDLDPRVDANTAGRLWRDCEDAKRTLSSRGKTAITCDYRGYAIRTEVTRELFHELTNDLLDRTEFTTRQALHASGLSWNQIDRVLLVGGSTRMPAVREMLEKLSGKQLDMSVSPDEAVAHGAALRAGHLLAFGKSHLSIRNVNSHSLGVVGADPITKRPRNGIIIPRNTQLPASSKRTFKTQKANQKSILVQVVEGENTSPDQCATIGKCVVRDLPQPLAAQTPVDVQFSYAENGRLRVAVSVEKVQLEHEFHRPNSLDQSQLDNWRLHVSKVPPPNIQ